MSDATTNEKKRTRKKRWSQIIEAHGVEIRVYERANSANLWYSVVIGGRKKRRSLKTDDRDEAEDRARAIATELAMARITGRDLRTGVTLGKVFAAYFEHRAPGLSDRWQKHAGTRRALFEEAWGRDLPVRDVSQTHVDRYSRLRRSGELSPFDPPGEEGRTGRKPVKVRDGTLDGDFRWLSSVFNWARAHKIEGKRLIEANPLRDVKWPKEKNPRQPVASHHRYLATQEHTDVVDPRGRLRCMLALARYTGRREGAIVALRASDVLLSPERIRAKLAALGMDERRAEQMPHGAIHWSPEADKMGLSTLTPISEPMRENLERYLAREPRIGDAPLFPADEDADACMRTDVAARWLLAAEQAAGMPKLKHGLWHPYRRLWASERKHLPDADVAAAGGWSDTTALRKSYQHADPDTILKVVQNGG